MNTPLLDSPTSWSRLPFHADMTRDDMERAAEYRRDYELRQAEALAERHRAQVKNCEAVRQRMAEILGADEAFDLQRFKRSLRHRDALRQAEEGRVDAREAAAIRATELEGYLKDRGIDLASFDAAATEIEKIFTPFPIPGASGVAVPGVSGTAAPADTQTVAIGPNATTPIATPPAADAKMPVGTAQAPTQTVPMTDEKTQEAQTATGDTQDTSNQTPVAITSNGKQ